MASAKYFASQPAFPDDLQPVAQIATVSLAKLVARDTGEAEAMLHACRTLGFFLLDLTGDPVGESLIAEVDAVFDVVRQTMELSMDEKNKFAQDPPRDFRGYKAQGIMKTETGAPDRCEFYNVSQDDLLGQSSAPRTNPDPIAAHTQLLRSYLEHGQFALTHILRALATQLELLPDTFRDLQAPNRASGTIMRLIRYAPSLTSADMRTGLLPHTDFGSVTLLANVLGGLQVLLPDSAPEDENSWQWVRPQPDCLIVNMGDAMVEWTGGVLRSNMHRVNYAPGDQRYIDRYAIAMLVRPYKEAPMSRLKGGRIPTLEDDQCEGIEIVNDNANNVGNLTAYEWELTKAMSLKEGSDCARSRGDENTIFQELSLDVGVEFIGERTGDIASDAPEPDISEEEKLRALEKECSSDMTILYVHGGGLYFSSPAEFRAASVRLAKMTKARVASIRYRLAPNNPFPAQILDTLIAYANLIHPPHGATWSAVPADRIVITGNSSGANLGLGLIKFLLEWQRLSGQPVASFVDFHGRAISLPLPAGIATPACMPGHPVDSIWPTNPPREHPYCAGMTLDHELVSPAAVWDWTGAPPMFFLCGSEERGIDGNRVVANQAAKSGVTVTWNEYEGMPHDFILIMAKLLQAKHAMALWARACVDFIASIKDGRTIARPSAIRLLMQDCKAKIDLGDPRDMSPLPFEEVRRKMREYNATRPVWTGSWENLTCRLFPHFKETRINVHKRLLYDYRNDIKGA